VYVVTCLFNSPPNYELILNRTPKLLEFTPTGCGNRIRLFQRKHFLFSTSYGPNIGSANIEISPAYVGPPFPEQDFSINYGVAVNIGSSSNPIFARYPGLWDDHHIDTTTYMPFRISLPNTYLDLQNNTNLAIVASVSTDTAADKVKFVQYELSIRIAAH